MANKSRLKTLCRLFSLGRHPSQRGLAMQVFSRFVHLEGSISKMMPSALACASNTITSLAGESVRHLLDAHPKLGTLWGSSHFISSQATTLKGGIKFSPHTWQELNMHEKGRAFCTSSNNFEPNSPQDNQGPSQPQPPQRTYDDLDSEGYQQMSPTIRRRPYNLEAKMRMKAYRREAMMQRRQQELEDEQKNFQLDYSAIYQKGAPGTVQGVVREIISLGYFVTLPNGREGFLAASHLGCSGGIPLLERLFKVGSEITVRVIEVPNPGRDRLYVRP